MLGGQRAGISTAQFLKIGVGGRAAALGEAFMAISDDASALYWNPAGLAQFTKNQVIFSHNIWVVDINHDFLGAVYHLDNDNTFGTSLTSFQWIICRLQRNLLLSELENISDLLILLCQFLMHVK